MKWAKIAGLTVIYYFLGQLLFTALVMYLNIEHEKEILNVTSIVWWFVVFFHFYLPQVRHNDDTKE